jgi:hypothetical protein
MYRANFMMIHHFGYSLTEIENMVPFELNIYMLLLQEQLEKEEEARKKRNGG